ncbi:hypothetical protein, partial [Streptomyces hirsutus]|uniref:hypothetical protein n=1 Tax=Streptomyces hirsutus TaxID=35620 RepID=UPI00332434F9
MTTPPTPDVQPWRPRLGVVLVADPGWPTEATKRLKKGDGPARDNTRPVIAMINPPEHIALLSPCWSLVRVARRLRGAALLRRAWAGPKGRPVQPELPARRPAVSGDAGTRGREPFVPVSVHFE